MFTAEEVLAIGLLAAGFTELVKFSKYVPDSYGLLVCAILSALCVGAYATSQPELALNRFLVWPLLTAFASVLFNAAGVYGFIRAVRSADVTDAKKTLVVMLVAGASVPGLAACGKRYVPGTTPQQAIAYELNEGLKPLVETQALVIEAVDAVCLPKEQPKDPAKCAALKPNADKFLTPVYELLQFVKKEVSPRLEQLDAAMKAVDTVRQGQLRAELVPMIEKVGALSAQAFGTALPDGLVAKVTTLAGKTITTFKELRDAITDVIRSVREDVTGVTPTPATTN